MRDKKPEGDAEWKDLTAHDAVRELMADFLDGVENTQVPATNDEQGGERFSAAAAAAMNRSGGIPGGKTPKEVAAGIEANNKVTVTGALPESILNVADEWSKSGATSVRRALAGKLLSEIPVEKRNVKIFDGREVKITSNGISNILQHMPNTKNKFRDGALEFVLNLPSFLENAEAFYRETKGLVHENFGGIVGFGGTPFYVSVTCTVDGDSLRVKAVNSIKKSSLNAWTETTASGKTGSVLRAFKLDTADVLRWILSNQDKSADDFRYWLQGYGDPAQESYSRVRVFHGSPHRFAAEDGHPFGRFRDDKMGTGEGAQAFGWGHYLTNVEGRRCFRLQKASDARRLCNP